MATSNRNLKNIAPLLLLLLLSAILIFTLNPLPPTPSPSVSFTPGSSSLPSNFTFIVKVLTFNRLPSLSRCLYSLSRAHYDGTTVHLHIFIDHFPTSTPRSSPLPDQIMDQNLNISRDILNFVDGFSWKFGEKFVHYRTSNAGLQAQWLEAWWPSSDDEFAFVVEDDLEVSPLYFRFLKSLIANYYYNSSNFSPMIYGASLQRPRFVAGKHGNKMRLDDETHVFLYQLVGTWGQLLFPRPWKEFRLWYDTHKSKGMKPFLEGMVTTGWYKKMGERIWTPWFIKFIQARGYFNIYTNFLQERALSVSHRDAGVNYGKTAGPDSILLRGTIDIKFMKHQPLNHLKWYDFCFREVLPNRIAKSLDEFGSILHTLPKLDMIILLSLYRSSESAIRNLLCHFERLNLQNYILMGPNSPFLLDLARRGHLVIDADRFSESTDFYRPAKFHKSNSELVKEVMVEASVIKKTMELNYKTWLLDANVIPLSSDAFLDSLGSSSDFYIGKAPSILFARSTSSASKLWGDDFIHEIVTIVNSLVTQDSSFTDITSTHVLKKLFEQKSMKFAAMDEMKYGLDIKNIHANQTYQEKGKRFAFWSPSTNVEMIQERLVQCGMWLVDSDFSCTAVACHPL